MKLLGVEGKCEVMPRWNTSWLQKHDCPIVADGDMVATIGTQNVWVTLLGDDKLLWSQVIAKTLLNLARDQQWSRAHPWKLEVCQEFVAFLIQGLSSCPSSYKEVMVDWFVWLELSELAAARPEPLFVSWWRKFKIANTFLDLHDQGNHR
jgi:hypothetical protein